MPLIGNSSRALQSLALFRNYYERDLDTLSVLLKPMSPNSLNLAWQVLKGDTIRLQPWFIIRRVSWLYTVPYTNRCHRDCKGDWLHRGIWCISVREATSVIGMLSLWLPGTWSKAHWNCKMEFPSFSRWSWLRLFLFSFSSILNPGRFHTPWSNSACVSPLLNLCPRAQEPQLQKLYKQEKKLL